MSRQLVCIGECMVEMAPLDGDGVYSRGFAGDTFNTAWYARRLLPGAWDVSYLSAIGDSKMSQSFADFAASAGLNTDLLRIIAGKNIGLYMVHLDHGERSFSYWRDTSAARFLAEDPAYLQAALSKADVVYLSGITVAILDAAGRGNLLDAIRDTRRQGALVAFDPNLRLRLWSSSAEMCSEVTKFAEMADVLLPSFEDEAKFFGDASPLETADRYLGGGPSTVVVKNGISEIFAVQGDLKVTVPLEEIVVPIDTTAAGDSFNAAFLAAYLQDEPLEQSVSMAASVAAKVVCGPGALIET